MEDLEGIILIGDIVKNGEVMLKQQKVNFHFKEEKSSIGFMKSKSANKFYEFHLTLEDKPDLEKGDKCQFVTDEKTYDVELTHINFPLQQFCFITFATQ